MFLRVYASGRQLTWPSQGQNTGSIPVGSATQIKKLRDRAAKVNSARKSARAEYNEPKAAQRRLGNDNSGLNREQTSDTRRLDDHCGARSSFGASRRRNDEPRPALHGVERLLLRVGSIFVGARAALIHAYGQSCSLRNPEVPFTAWVPTSSAMRTSSGDSDSSRIRSSKCTKSTSTERCCERT